MAERFKAPVLKTGEGLNLPWVRIPLSPPFACLDRAFLGGFGACPGSSVIFA